MTAMAPDLAIVAPVVLSAGAIGLPIAANAVLRHLRLRKVLPVMRRAFTILDPLLNDHLANYRGSDVQFAAELITAVLADGELSSDEVSFAAGEILKRWSPAIAAGKTGYKIPAQSQEDKIYDAIEDVIGRGYTLTTAIHAVKQAIR